MFDYTGVDAVMIGRGAQGNPWIFSELLEYERTGILPQRPSMEELKEMMLRHARLQIEHKGEFLGVGGEMRNKLPPSFRLWRKSTSLSEEGYGSVFFIPYSIRKEQIRCGLWTDNLTWR